MALLILAHPYYAQSIANKTIVNELIKTYPDLEVRDIFQLYPDYKLTSMLNKKRYYAMTPSFCNILCSGLICRQF
ncbi:Glutathione-regulated potassium-efflux system ancillary protein KefF [Acinetobacter baumannii]|nr:Glutathione-regulated potassium-efflux system ancillary protein KefF [Acinetobacter baumannii]